MVKAFKTPQKSIGTLDADVAARLVTSSADVALILDRDGVVRDVAVASDELAAEGWERWIGLRWADTVTTETRQKVEALLRDAAADSSESRRRQVNHPSQRGPDVPVLYGAVRIGRSGRFIVTGRDLRAISMLQQRLVDAQQSMERDYWRLRSVETRYRLLFQMSSEAILIVDAQSLRVQEANPSAVQLLGDSQQRIVGRALSACFDATTGRGLDTLLAGVRTSGRGDAARVRLADDSRELVISAVLFRQEDASLLLLRLAPIGTEPERSGRPEESSDVFMLAVARQAPDAIIVTDRDGRVRMANAAALELAQVAGEAQLRNEPLERWLGRAGVDVNVLIANLRQSGAVRLYQTQFRGDLGGFAEVELSAVAITAFDQIYYGFLLRNIAARLPGAEPAPGELPRSAEALKRLVGRVSLRDLVQESTDLIERLCIEAALELTRGNRASAAEMLGLSRQSLYVKMRRYGVGDNGTEEAN